MVVDGNSAFGFPGPWKKSRVCGSLLQIFGGLGCSFIRGGIIAMLFLCPYMSDLPNEGKFSVFLWLYTFLFLKLVVNLYDNKILPMVTLKSVNVCRVAKLKHIFFTEEAISHF